MNTYFCEMTVWRVTNDEGGVADYYPVAEYVLNIPHHLFKPTMIC